MALATLDPSTIGQLIDVIPAYGNVQNPVDVTAAVMSQPGMFDECVRRLADDPAVDAVIACFAVLVGDDVTRIAQALGHVREVTGKPVLAARTGAASLAPEGARLLNEHGVPVFPTPERAVAALRALRDACRPGRATGSLGLVAEVAVPASNATEAQVKEILATAGLPIPESMLVANAAEAQQAVVAVGGRSVFKAVVPGLLHKSDAGGVVIDVEPAGAEAAFDQCAALGGEVLVERFVPGGVEVLVSVSPSPLGRVITVGVGGVLTEVMADVAVTLTPVGSEDIEELLDRTRVGTLLAGVRGGAPADRAALVSVVERVAQTVAQWPEDMELELNPVTVLADGCWILDAVAHRPTSLDSTNDRGETPQGEGEN